MASNTSGEFKTELKKPSFWLGLVIVLSAIIPTLWFACHFFSAWQHVRAYNKIMPGDSEQRVIALMGKPGNKGPDSAIPRTANIDADTTSSFVVKYFWYSDGLASQYTIGIDNKGRVATKDYVTSP